LRTWLRRLKDVNAFARIVARIRRMEQGSKDAPLFCFCAGTKQTQASDVRRAKELAERL
jgi:putative component of toxin-antitoxin plasmid stabilization module